MRNIAFDPVKMSSPMQIWRSDIPSFGEDANCLISLIRQQIVQVSPLPVGTVYFGVSIKDGRPVLLDIKTPNLGSILLCGDRSSGKTALLKAVASGITYVFDPQDVQFAVVTSAHYSEWQGWKNLPHCAGLFSSNHGILTDIVDALDVWTSCSNAGQTLLLFIDGFRMADLWDKKRYSLLQDLLTFGPYQNIWPIVATDAENFSKLASWGSCFGRHLFSVPGCGDSVFDFEFAMREDSVWCPFSILGSSDLVNFA